METMPKTKRTYQKKEGKVFLREWLAHRDHMTAEALAAKIDAPKSAISKLLNGRQQYTNDWLGRIAWGLDCEVWELYRTPPVPQPLDANELLDKMSLSEKRTALTVLYDLAREEKPANLFESLEKPDPALNSPSPKGS